MNNQRSTNFWVKLVLLTGANFVLIAGGGLSTAMPAMLIQFADIPGAALLVSMIVTLPALFVVLGGPVVGFLTDRFGRKPVLVGGLLLGGLAGISGFFLTNIVAILVGRVLVGFGIAATMTATNALIADYFSGQARAKFMGFQAAVGGLGVVIFLPIGGLLADISWEYTFLTYLSVLLLFLPALFAIREPQVTKADQPLTEKSKFQPSRVLIYILVANFFLQFAFMTLPVFLAYHLDKLFGASGLQVGLTAGLSGLMTFLGGLSYERIGRKTSFNNLVLIGFSLVGLGFLMIGTSNTWLMMILSQLILGFGMGLNAANLTTWIAHEAAPEVRGRANGLFVTLLFLGQFLTALVFTPIVNATSYGFGYVLGGLIVILIGVSSLLIKKRVNQVQDVG